MTRRFYCFICPNGHATEMHIPYEETKEEHLCPACGQPMKRDFQTEHSCDRSGTHGLWPMVSESCAVHPSQIAQAKRLIRDKSGVDCEFDSEGRPTFTSAEHKRKCLSAMGYVEGHTDRHRWI